VNWGFHAGAVVCGLAKFENELHKDEAFLLEQLRVEKPTQGERK
jgi:uncharacterized protein (DUF169 family)